MRTNRERFVSCESPSAGTPSPIGDGGRLGWGRAVAALTLPHDCVAGEGMYSLSTS